MSLVKRRIVYSLLSTFSSLVKGTYANHVRVLAYHTVPDVRAFEKQIIYLKSNFNIIDIHEFEKHVLHGIKLKPNALLITFDDGDQTIYANGLPVLKKHNVPGLVFIITELIGTTRPFWWNLVTQYYNRNKEAHLARKKINLLKTVPNAERLKFIDTIQAEISDLYQKQLSTSQVKELVDNRISVANHSHTHPMFDQVTDIEYFQDFRNVKTYFEEEQLKGFEWFAYPNGNADKAREHYLKDLGIKLAFLFDHKINPKEIHPLRVSRIKVNTYDPLPEFKVKVSGLHSIITK